MNGAYTICKAQETDMEEILRLQQIAYQSEAILYNDYSIQPLTQTIEQATAEYRGCVVLKAVMDGKIIGSVRAYEKGCDAYIDDPAMLCRVYPHRCLIVSVSSAAKYK